MAVYSLTRAQDKLIKAAAETLVDMFRDDMQGLIEGGSHEHAYMAGFLPRRYNHRYTLEFFKLFFDAVLVVAWKIHDRRRWQLNSVAEELAMRAFLQQADVLAELQGKQFDSEDLYDVIFPDADFEFLFNEAFDGIEDGRADFGQMGIENLRFDDWFKPFNSKTSFRSISPEDR